MVYHLISLCICKKDKEKKSMNWTLRSHLQGFDYSGGFILVQI